MNEQKKVFELYKKLLRLYPQPFRERFGESMEQTFSDVCNERKRQAKTLSNGFLFWTFGETCVGIIKENFTEIKWRNIMESAVSNAKSSAIIGLLLAMPLAILFLIEMYSIEPLSGFLRMLTTNAEGQGLNLFGKIFILGTLLLLPLGFIISFNPVVRNIRTGNGLTTNRLNLLIAAAIFIFIAALSTGFVIDQYPCWMGVPNCD